MGAEASKVFLWGLVILSVLVVWSGIGFLRSLILIYVYGKSILFPLLRNAIGGVYVFHSVLAVMTIFGGSPTPSFFYASILLLVICLLGLLATVLSVNGSYLVHGIMPKIAVIIILLYTVISSLVFGAGSLVIIALGAGIGATIPVFWKRSDCELKSEDW